jgi:pyruvate formate lyase activating enzyme
MNRRSFLTKLSSVIAPFIAVCTGGCLSTAFALGRRFSDKPKAESKIDHVPFHSPREVMFYDELEGKKIRCNTCFRRCVVQPGKVGFCRVRENRDGKYYSTVYGAPSAIQIDPVEKEPQLHMLPGTDILCFGTVGCNFKCRHCHNWHLSQASPGDREVYDVPPEKAVEIAIERKIPTISFTYNEPTVFYEYVYDIAVLAKKKNVKILWHSNGGMNPEPLRQLLEFTDAVTVDLKGFTDKAYQNSAARLEPVMETLKIIKEEGKWLEIVNLVIPTVNDDPGDIRRMCEWITKEIGLDTPLHFSRFFPNYKLTHLSPTPIEDLERARKIAMDEGLLYVTIGNVPGHKYNSTFCPNCGKRLIHRVHFQVKENHIVHGRCKFCQHLIPGIWG